MKAIVCKNYGTPEQLEMQEIDKPIPGPNEVLVKVRATAVNDYDWSMVIGKPRLYRLMFGLFKPKNKIPGMEVSGIVEEAGSEVVGLKVGDAVFGDTSDYGFGTYAEYIALDYRAFHPKPDAMSFEDAAALPHASLLAYQGLIELGGLQQGQKILINGAGGGVGAIALQLAKMHDANVTGVDTGEKLQNMRSMGFDHVIDYKKLDYTKLKDKFDLILDTRTQRSPFACARALKAGGTFVTVGGDIGNLLQFALFKGIIKAIRGKKLMVLGLKPNKGLDKIGEYYRNGDIRTTIEGPYTLENAGRALRKFGDATHFGKVVITI